MRGVLVELRVVDDLWMWREARIKPVNGSTCYEFEHPTRKLCVLVASTSSRVAVETLESLHMYFVDTSAMGYSRCCVGTETEQHT